MTTSRRSFLAASALSGAASPALAQPRPATVRPRRLQPGDTIGLINPSKAVFERQI